jgi:hypothetical protein
VTMSREVRDRWVTALRSGDYAQGVGKLTWVVLPDDEDAREYCCLGVLCDLAVRNDVVSARVGDGVVAYDGVINYLPSIVQEWAGLARYGSNPTVRYRGELRTLSTLNDTRVSFNKIADLIEEHL